MIIERCCLYFLKEMLNNILYELKERGWDTSIKSPSEIYNSQKFCADTLLYQDTRQGMGFYTDAKKDGFIINGCCINHKGNYLNFFDNLSDWEFPEGFSVDEDDLVKEIDEINKARLKPDYNKIYVLLGTSGSGKTTLINHLLTYMPYLKQATKVTTRPQREENLNDGTKTITIKEFNKLCTDKEIILPYNYDDNIYGYYKQELGHFFRDGYDIILDTCNPKIASEFKSLYYPHAKIVCVESYEKDIEERLIRRYNQLDLKRINKNFLKKSKDTRLNQMIKSNNLIDRMKSIADFIISEPEFILRQRDLRGYILRDRNQKIIKQLDNHL